MHFFVEKRIQFLVFSVILFIALTKCSQWMVLVLSNEVPYVFQLTGGKRILSDSHLSLKHTFYMTCILNLPELCQLHERG